VPDVSVAVNQHSIFVVHIEGFCSCLMEDVGVFPGVQREKNQFWESREETKLNDGFGFGLKPTRSGLHFCLILEL